MVLKRAEAFELREPGVSYKIDFGLKTTMLGLETSISGTLMQRFQYDNLARPHFFPFLCISSFSLLGIFHALKV